MLCDNGHLSILLDLCLCIARFFGKFVRYGLCGRGILVAKLSLCICHVFCT